MTKPALVLYQGNAFTVAGRVRRIFEKDVLRVGRWKHPITGQDVEISQDRINRIAADTGKLLETMDRKAIPFQDGHNFDAKKTLGWWTGFRVEGDRLYGQVEVTDEEAARKIEAGSIRSVSARIDSDVRDTKGGVYAEAMTHVCATPLPVLDGQHDFVKLSREIDCLDLFVDEPISGNKPKEMTMNPKEMATALGLDPEKATAEQILGAAKKSGEDLKAALAKLKGFEGLSAVKPEELSAHGLELKDGKIGKVAPPPSDESPAMKALREENEKLKATANLSRLQDIKTKIEGAAKEFQITPALVPAFSELASIESEVTALCLSADGASAQKKSVNALGRVMEILKGLPKLNASSLTELSGEAKGEQKKIEESATKKSSELLARAGFTALDEKGTKK